MLHALHTAACGLLAVGAFCGLLAGAVFGHYATRRSHDD